MKSKGKRTKIRGRLSKGNMTVAVFGTGYVGIVTAATILNLGYRVICVDIVPEIVETVKKGRSPVHEPGVDKVLKDAIRSGRLSATTDGRSAVEASDISFICVGTPSRPNGAIDLRQVKAVSRVIGRGLKGRKGYHVVVVKSTVVPSTCLEVVLPVLRKASGRTEGKDFGLVCNPEFLKEGTALEDGMGPDRIVIGAIDGRSSRTVLDLYRRLRGPVVMTDLTTAEMIKYASNAFLATKVALSNEMANVCSAQGIDVYEVMKGVGLDKRIGPLFLRAGAGFGGSCFPKDVKALVHVGRKAKVDLRILPSVLKQNELQPLETVRMLKGVLGDLEGQEIALLGVAFKPDTDDIRETRAAPMARGLVQAGARVRVYDPNRDALDKFMDLMGDQGGRLRRAASLEEALSGAHGCIVQTEWREFRSLGPKAFLRLMKRAVIVDGRRTFDPLKMEKAGLIYRGIGWKNR